MPQLELSADPDAVAAAAFLTGPRCRSRRRRGDGDGGERVHPVRESHHLPAGADTRSTSGLLGAHLTFEIDVDPLRRLAASIARLIQETA